MLKNPAAGMGAMQMMDQRALDQAQMAANQGAGDLRSSQARQEGAIADLIQGYTGQGSSQPGGQGGGQPGDLTGLKVGLSIASMDPAKIQAAEDRARYSSGWKDSALDKYRTTDAKDMQRFAPIVELRSAMKNFNSKDPLSVYKMLTMFQKGIDEGVVRQDDVANIQRATGTGFQELKAMAFRLWQSGTDFPEVMGDALRKQLDFAVGEKMAGLHTLSQAHESFGDRSNWSEAGRNRAIPYRKEVQAFQEGLNNLSAGFMHTLPDGSQVLVAPKGEGFQTIDSATGEFID